MYSEGDVDGEELMRTLSDSHRAPRVWVDVLASRVANEEAGLAESTTSDTLSAHSSAEDGGAVVRTARPLAGSSVAEEEEEEGATGGISISALATAERQLRKGIPFTSGGTMVSFTKDDVARLSDPAVLQFLQNHSQRFNKYVRPAAPDTAAPSAPFTAAADVEADINELQREIETFITAVDQAGQSYQIHLDDSGHLVVPVADLDEEAEEEEDEKDSTLDVKQAGSTSPSSSSSSHPSSPSRVSSAPRQPGEHQAGGYQPHGEGHPSAVDPGSASELAAVGLDVGEGNMSMPQSPSASIARPSARRNAAPVTSSETVHRRAKGSGEGGRTMVSQGVPAFQRKPAPLAQERARRGKKPATAVRVRGLLPEEDARIDRLLRCDGDTLIARPSPFKLSSAAEERISAIDDALGTLRMVRGAVSSSSTSRVAPSGAGDGAPGVSASPSLRDVDEPPPAQGRTALGNRYMREAQQARVREAQLSRINEQLERLHREVELLASDESPPDLPASVLSLRPAWLQAHMAPAFTEDRVQEMVCAAAEEDQRANVHGLPSPPSSSRQSLDAVVVLRDHLATVVARASQLVSDSSSHPIELPVEEEEIDDASGQ